MEPSVLLYLFYRIRDTMCKRHDDWSTMKYETASATVVGSIPTWGNEIFDIFFFPLWQSTALSSLTQHAIPNVFGGN